MFPDDAPHTHERPNPPQPAEPGPPAQALDGHIAVPELSSELSSLMPSQAAEAAPGAAAAAAAGGAGQAEHAQDQPSGSATEAAAELHVCFHCSSELAYPLDWSEAGPRHWRIVLRCPECEARREGVFEQASVERLDDELDSSASALLADLRQLTHSNMSEEIDFFVRALAADVILPSDF